MLPLLDGLELRADDAVDGGEAAGRPSSITFTLDDGSEPADALEEVDRTDDTELREEPDLELPGVGVPVGICKPNC